MERLTEYDNMNETYEVRDCVPFSKAINKLAEYEELEEQGLLVKIPNVINKIVYRISQNGFGFLSEYRVDEIFFDESYTMMIRLRKPFEQATTILFEELGRYPFYLDKEQAINKIEEIKPYTTKEYIDPKTKRFIGEYTYYEEDPSIENKKEK